ncbi:hypothetical protein ACFQDD_07010 [Halorubrum pallidum]|uniref:Uncharacterized protein n=1 Tax=Halorubrum pallidum TaxID=1526114 RepID=A0ABD5T615_9EURY
MARTQEQELESVQAGDSVYVEIGTGSVLRGTVLDGPPSSHGYSARADTGDRRVVRVQIDHAHDHGDGGLPDHMAPEEYQPPDAGAVFRDAYTIDADEQTYLVDPERFRGRAE